MRTVLLLTAGLAGGLMVSGRALAGVTIVSQRGAGAPSTMYLDGARLRIEMPERNERASVILIDASTRRQVMIDDKNKTYVEITDEDRKRMRAQMDAMRAQMQERTKNMSPQQRKQMEQAMGPLGAGDTGKPHEWKYESLRAKKTVNGFDCEMYRVTEDGLAREEVCVSPWSAGLVKKEDFAGLAKFGKEMAEEMGMGKGSETGSDMFGRMEKAPGIPISRVPIQADGTRGEETQIKGIKHGSVPASMFAIPAGYTKKDLPMGGMGPGGRHHGPGPAPR